MTRRIDAPPSPKKRPYRAPELTVHGNLKTLTMSKSGRNADGSGKPRTKNAGGNA
jgi:hypothetical protein